MATNEPGRNRSAAEIERELERTRSEINRTIDAIQYKITPGQLANDALGYMGGANEFARNLGIAAKNNPIPVVLVGLGIAWLAMGGGTPGYLRESRASSEGDISAEDDSTLSSAASRSVAAGGRTAADMAGRVRRAGSGFLRAIRRAGETSSGIGSRVSDTASEASERVRAMADDVRDLAAEWREGTSEMSDAARERIYRARDVVQERTMQMRGGASDLMRDQPLVVGALGLAIGAVLGAMLPITRRENEMMGETRDQLLDQAQEAGTQVLNQAADAGKNVANAATNAARGEAEKRGLAPDQSAEQSGEQSKDSSYARRPSAGPNT